MSSFSLKDLSRLYSAVSLCLVLLLLTLLAPRPVAWPAGDQVEILIAAAASIAPYCQGRAKAFEAANPGVKVAFTFASSGLLRQQIEAGVLADGYISASEGQMDLLEKKGLLRPSSKHVLAGNRLALIISSRVAAHVKSFTDLYGPSVTYLALGEPSHVPVGYYGRATLLSLGLWDKLKPKMVFGIDARQVLEYVMKGEADAGLVYLSDAHFAGKAVQVVSTAPEGSHPPIIYPMAVLRDASHPTETAAFFAFLLTKNSQNALSDYGLEPARPGPSGQHEGARP